MRIRAENSQILSIRHLAALHAVRVTAFQWTVTHVGWSGFVLPDNGIHYYPTEP